MASLYKKPVIIRDPRTGEKVKARSRKWWGRFRDATGQEKRVPLAADHTAAQSMLNEQVRRVEREKVGIVDPTDEYHKRPLWKHVADYRQYLKSKANEKRYVDMAVGRINTLLTGCRFKYTRYRSWRPTLATMNVVDGAEAERGMGAQIVDRLRHGSLTLFCNWASHRKAGA